MPRRGIIVDSTVDIATAGLDALTDHDFLFVEKGCGE